MQPSADIVSISTGRENFLIGPASAFGIRRNHIAIREPGTVRIVVRLMVQRQGLGGGLSVLMRRWGIETGATRPSTPQIHSDILERAIFSGRLSIASVPDATIGFSSGQIDQETEAVIAAVKPTRHLPESMAGRLRLLVEMVPNHLTGEAKQAFIQAVQGQGTAAVVGMFVRIGVRFVPLLGWAVLAYDLHSMSTEAAEALDKLQEKFEEIRAAKTQDDIDDIAKAVAAILTTLFFAGVLAKILGLRTKNRGPDGKGNSGKGGGKTDRKGGGDGDKGKPKEKVRDKDDIQESAGNGKRPAKPPKLKQPQKGVSEGDAVVPRTRDRDQEILDGYRSYANNKTAEKEGWPTLDRTKTASFRGDPKPVHLEEGQKLYRVVGDGSRPNGEFWTTTPPPRTESQWRAQSAVKNDWNGDGGYVEYTVPKGGLNVWEGPARAQLSSDKKGVLPGGGNQIVLNPETAGIPSDLPVKATPWNH